MRFLFVIATFRPSVGGTQRRAALLSRSLVSKGHSVTVLTQQIAGTAAREMIEGVEVVRFPPPPGGRAASAFFALRTAPFFHERGRRFDLYHVFLASSPALFTSSWAKEHGVPAVLSFGGGGGTGDAGTSSRTLLGRWKLHRLKSLFRLFLCPNSSIRDEFLALGYPAERLQVLPGGVDVARFLPPGGEERMRSRLELEWEGRTVLLYTGRLETGKGLDGLLRSLPRLAKRHQGLLLVLAGEGRLRRRLEATVGELKMEAHVRFSGSLGESGVLRHLHGADVFVLPSRAEGVSNSLLEAMACAVPPAVSDIPGAGDLLGHGRNGLLFSPDARDSLSAALESLIADGDLRRRLGEEARKTVVERFSSEAMTERYLALVEPLAGA